MFRRKDLWTRVHDDSYGFWRRVRLIPFTRQFMGTDDDKELTGKLITEAPGILAWMVQGCRRWLTEGADPTPECITVATREYEADSDPLSEFILDECILAPGARVQAGELYKAYKAWAADQGMTEKETMTMTAFGRRMGQKFKKIRPHGTIFYENITLKNGGQVDSLVDSFIGNDTESEVNLPMDTRVGNKCENPPQPLTLSTQDDVLPPYPENPCPKCGGEWTLNNDCTKYVCSGCGYEYEG